jgi:hypothetical protein
MRIRAINLLVYFGVYFGAYFLIQLFLVCTSLFAAEFGGSVSAEHRQFFSNPQYVGQKDGSNVGLTVEPEFYHNSKNRNHSFVSKLFYRHDQEDDNRTHFDIRQLDYTFSKDDYEVRAGISKVYWGVTESRHLVDVINQTDTLEDIDGEEKLGQAMVQLSKFSDIGDFRLFYLPHFRKNSFGGKEGRIRGVSVVDNNNEIYEKDVKEWYPAFALRYENNIGDFDIGLAQFHGTSREASFLMRNGNLTPFYEIINQSSLDLQYTYDAWLFKLESLYRSGHAKAFGAMTAGFEYTLFTVLGGSHDLGMLMEYHYDGRDDSAPATLFDKDVFFGLRYALNDASDTEFLSGATFDVNGKGISAIFEASHRFSDKWKGEFNVRIFSNIERSDGFFFLDNDDYAKLKLSYFF